MIVCENSGTVVVERKPRASPNSKKQPQSEGGRIMILSGIWTMPNCQYDLYAILHLQAAGHADGTINWHANRVHGVQQSYSAIEKVSGLLLEQRVTLLAYETDPMLYPDHYRISLSGDSGSGSFRGTSETCHKDWSGRMHGTYMFLNQG